MERRKRSICYGELSLMEIGINNVIIYFAVIGGMFVGFCIWFDRIRTSHHKKVLSKKQKKEITS